MVFELEESLGLEAEDDYEDDCEDDDEPTESYVSITCPSCSYTFYYRCEEDGEEDNPVCICPSCGIEISSVE